MNDDCKQTTRFNRVLLVLFHLDKDSQVLKWQHEIALALASESTELVVLTEHIGTTSLPSNVRVIVVPRLFQSFPLRILGLKWLMLAPLYSEMQRGFDVALFHMNIEWVYRLGILLKLFKIPTVIWYAHGAVSFRLKIAHFFADKILTSSPLGFRIKSQKVTVIGQGVDTETYHIEKRVEDSAGRSIMFVGRISPTKNIELILRSFAATLKAEAQTSHSKLILKIIGAPPQGPESSYLTLLKDLALQLEIAGQVLFLGALSAQQIAKHYQSDAALHLSFSQTGSMDKTVLEALSCGCPVLTSNFAFKSMFIGHEDLFIESSDPLVIANRISCILKLSEAGEIKSEQLRCLVVNGNHSFKGYLQRLIAELTSATGEKEK